MNAADDARRYRDRRRGSAPRPLAPHGTRAGAVRHRRNAEAVCEECAEAERAYVRARAKHSLDRPESGRTVNISDTTTGGCQ